MLVKESYQEGRSREITVAVVRAGYRIRKKVQYFQARFVEYGTSFTDEHMAVREALERNARRIVNSLPANLRQSLESRIRRHLRGSAR